MRILVIGATGMLGHRLLQRLAKEWDTWGTVRAVKADDRLASMTSARLIPGVTAEDQASLGWAFREARPDVVINCAGNTNHRPPSEELGATIVANALLPHRLADLCAQDGSRLIQVSTDCVFSGRRGGYVETDPPDPIDFYGHSKLLGEIARPGCLTVRTSMIGWQLSGSRGLAEWFSEHRRERLQGYRQVVFSGLTTAALSDVIAMLVAVDRPLEGLYHVAAEPIDKDALLRKLAAALEWDVSIASVDDPKWDRSLNGERFRVATGWVSPSWEEMLAGLALERPFYERWRKE